MKKLFISIAILLLTNQVFCQDINNYQEQIHLNTDRSLYITGESIEFSAVLSSNKTTLSKIVYVELITPNGKQVYGGKYAMENSKCYGIAPTPENLSSGNYYVRAYTKFMRNNGPSSYNYQYIKIINPYTEDILNGVHEDDSSEFKLESAPISKNNFSIELSKDTFKLREAVHVKIIKHIPDSTMNMAISVAPKATINYKKAEPLKKSVTTNQYMPETRGVSLTGLLKDKTTGEPLVRKKINLSILESNKNSFYSTFTGPHGHFYFALPDIAGKKDIFLSPEYIDGGIEPQLLVDNDFCTEPVNLPNPKFSLTTQEQSAAYKLAVNHKVQGHFLNKPVENEGLSKQKTNDSLPFYGLPTSTLNLNDYVDLPTLEDYFTEIPFLVRIRKVKGEKQFKIIGTHPELAIYEPLIMIDMVPVNSIKHILEISPENVDRIEVVAAPYVKGEVTYGGIINIISVKNDLAGIKLPESGMFFNYLFLENNYKLDNDSAPKMDNIPDARNNLYWNPEINTNSKGTFKFSFKTADTDGTYIICVTGITKTGKKLISTKTFEVK